MTNQTTDGVGMHSPVQRLADAVLHMDLVTPRGQRARVLAREALAAEDELLHALRLIEHATAPTPDDGGHHEAAHEIARAAILKATTKPPEQG